MCRSEHWYGLRARDHEFIGTGLDYPGDSCRTDNRDLFRSEHKAHHPASNFFMSPALVLVGVILALGIWGYLQRGDVLYIVNKLSASDIAQFAANAGFPDVATATAIALAESGGDPEAIGDKSLAPTNGPSIGLWQINIGSKANSQFANVDLTDPQTNANAAFQIFQQQGFGAWSTFNGGQYLAFMQAAQDAVQS